MPSAHTGSGIACQPPGASAAICTFDGTDTITCSVSECVENGTNVYAVQDYNATGNNDFAAWGSFEGNKWCCAINDDATPVIENFVIRGCDWSDEVLSFQWPPV